MSIRKQLIGFATFAAAALLLTWVMYATLLRGVEGDTTTYTATFSDVLGLEVGDDIRISGVRVGRVDAIELDAGNNARVRFQVQSNQSVYDTSKALVRYQNLIGQRYIELTRGDGNRPVELEPGAQIPLDRTEPSYDVSSLLGGLQPLFEVLAPDQVNSLSQTFIQAVQGDQISLGGFLAQAAALAATFNDRDAVLSDLIDNLSAVIDGLAGHSGQFETRLAQTRTLVAGLYAQGRQLQDSTERAAAATTALAGMVDQIRPTLDRAQDSSMTALQLLLGAGTKLDQLAFDAPTALTDLARVTSEGAYLSSYLCRFTVSLGGFVLPQSVWNELDRTALGQSHSPICR